jgi:ribokinase
VTDVVVVGQIARDLVLRVDELPAGNHATPVRERRELLGGKGANQAVALTQLGTSAALVGVVGDDEVGDRLRDQAHADGVDVTHVVRRGNTRTGLIVDVVDARRRWHYLEDLPDEVLVTEADVAAASTLIRNAKATVIQLRQPVRAAEVAARTATGLVVLDGACGDELLQLADVVRADHREAELLAGRSIDGPDDAAALAAELLDRHELSFVALAVADYGDVFAWPGERLCLPYRPAEVVDTTGAGDAMTAALTSVLCQGGDPARAARLGAVAAAATVSHLGGRPELVIAGLLHA